MIRQEVAKLIWQVAEGRKEDIQVKSSESEEFGDYTTNVAFRLSQNTGKDATEEANIIGSKILKLKPSLFDKIETKGSGFLNFFISREYFQKQVADILKKRDGYGQLDIGKGKKINIEFISANPTGKLHIGNGRSAFFGDALANVLEKAGYKVVREYFVNNAKNSNQIKELGKTALGKGNAYFSEYLKRKIESINSSIKNSKNEADAGYLLAKEIQGDTRNFIENGLKIRFNNWVFEEDFYKKNKIKNVFEELKKKKMLYQENGEDSSGGEAWWLKTSEFGDKKDWVAVRGTGEPTYLLSDIAYHKDKFDRGFDRVIDIWGADHQAHVSKIKAAAKILGFQGVLDILVLQLVALKGGEKLSKRKGEIIALEDLVREIGLDAARFFYLQKSLDSHMEIDLDLAKEQSEKNPVCYAQYANARMRGILEKSKEIYKTGEKRINQEKNLKLLTHHSELSLIKRLVKFPEIIEDTACDYQVQRLPRYALTLAADFHRFYRDCRVVSDDKNLTEARLSLILAAKIVLKEVFDLIGVSVPEKM